MCKDGVDRTGWPGQLDPEDGAVVRETAASVERNARMARWFGLGLITVGVLAMVATSAATVYVGTGVRDLLDERVEVARRTAEAQEKDAVLVYNVMNCLLGQFAEHRLSARAHHELTAEEAQEPVTNVGEPTPYEPEKTKAACDAVLKEPTPKPTPRGP